jgi:hypothetical protein
MVQASQIKTSSSQLENGNIQQYSLDLPRLCCLERLVVPWQRGNSATKQAWLGRLQTERQMAGLAAPQMAAVGWQRPVATCERHSPTCGDWRAPRPRDDGNGATLAKASTSAAEPGGHTRAKLGRRLKPKHTSQQSPPACLNPRSTHHTGHVDRVAALWQRCQTLHVRLSITTASMPAGCAWRTKSLKGDSGTTRRRLAAALTSPHASSASACSCRSVHRATAASTELSLCCWVVGIFLQHVLSQQSVPEQLCCNPKPA